MDIVTFLQGLFGMLFGFAILDLIKFFATLPLLYYVVVFVLFAIFAILKFGFHFDIQNISFGVSLDFQLGGVWSIAEFVKKKLKGRNRNKRR